MRRAQQTATSRISWRVAEGWAPRPLAAAGECRRKPPSARGVATHPARLVARRAFGGPHRVRHRHHHRWGRRLRRGLRPLQRGHRSRPQHPYDDQVWLGGIDALHKLPAGVDAVVSLCRIGTDHPRTGADHVQVWLAVSVVVAGGGPALPPATGPARARTCHRRRSRT